MVTKTNYLKCPRLKSTTIEVKDNGDIQIIETFCDCVKRYCAAWNTDHKACGYFLLEGEKGEDEE